MRPFYNVAMVAGPREEFSLPHTSTQASTALKVFTRSCRRRLKSEPPNQDGKVITLENWELIRHLRLSEGESMRSIAQKLEISRNTVAKAVASSNPPHYERTAAPNSVSRFVPQIRSLLSEYPKMTATVIAERIGWAGASSFLRMKGAEIRPDYARVDSPIASTMSRVTRCSVTCGSRR